MSILIPSLLLSHILLLLIDPRILHCHFDQSLNPTHILHRSMASSGRAASASQLHRRLFYAKWDGAEDQRQDGRVMLFDSATHWGYGEYETAVEFLQGTNVDPPAIPANGVHEHGEEEEDSVQRNLARDRTNEAIYRRRYMERLVAAAGGNDDDDDIGPQQITMMMGGLAQEPMVMEAAPDIMDMAGPPREIVGPDELAMIWGLGELVPAPDMMRLVMVGPPRGIRPVAPARRPEANQNPVRPNQQQEEGQRPPEGIIDQRPRIGEAMASVRGSLRFARGNPLPAPQNNDNNAEAAVPRRRVLEAVDMEPQQPHRRPRHEGPPAEMIMEGRLADIIMEMRMASANVIEAMRMAQMAHVNLIEDMRMANANVMQAMQAAIAAPMRLRPFRNVLNQPGARPKWTLTQLQQTLVGRFAGCTTLMMDVMEGSWERLSIEDWKRVCQALAASLPNLTSIEATYAEHLSDNKWAALLACFPNLASLKFKHVGSFTETFRVVGTLKHLECLSFTDDACARTSGSGLSPVACVALGKAFLQLKSLSKLTLRFLIMQDPRPCWKPLMQSIRQIPTLETCWVNGGWQMRTIGIHPGASVIFNRINLDASSLANMQYGPRICEARKLHLQDPDAPLENWISALAEVGDRIDCVHYLLSQMDPNMFANAGLEAAILKEQGYENSNNKK
jgi:hypothetical protein